MKKDKRKYALAFCAAAVLAMGCANAGDGSTTTTTGGGSLASTCETVPTAGMSQVCEPSAGVARHYRIEGVMTSVAHSSASIFLGFASQPVSGNTDTTSGQAKIQVYHGNGMAPPPQSNVDFSAQSETVTPAFSDFTATAQTICFDVTTASPPRITLWATGKNGADCAVSSTLTAASSLFNKSDWTTAVQLTSANVYFYLGTSATTAKVTAYTTIMGTGL